MIANKDIISPSHLTLGQEAQIGIGEQKKVNNDEFLFILIGQNVLGGVWQMNNQCQEDALFISNNAYMCTKVNAHILLN